MATKSTRKSTRKPSKPKTASKSPAIRSDRRLTATKAMHNPHLITPNSARNYLTPKEARYVYSQLRSAALKRLKRFEGTRYTKSQFYKYNAMRYPALKELDDRQVYSAIVDVRNFLRNKRSTVRGMKTAEAKSIETLQRHGFDYVTEENFYRFAEFMQKKRDETVGRYFDSAQVAELFAAMESKDRDTLEEEFNEYLEDLRGAGM